ncbi:CRISPR-associated protein Cmr4 [Thermosipho melanesiensis]|uniref:CRISPR-associated RAMP protein, Cmr4 family n=2 Tax=Thermosipho melanesiensis TaxID=46541 RepID=A6LNK3_THEM4|nr:type III-B CRISPR module RAMP protein Cmr4 [Thermosipho melanesiensis]ABR31504.1 CRISPR-associated RAMP protein, Cmr4 family [Thermosipho melanesiensis BI429]APT74557.1 CRISPR-associated protein Cmr4 [Thermosipho melanesiensis]OOC35472.1 CRISPR-associated protein Cmr4 [Thermosipho melanesiensis]OOC36509.1 CRISPR-associated protein Cmr4 [Thermosipho melanesiensis]OOC36832.1 CRISPR-associated protein Cmr4 [Thermosipho melanesiensis]
MNGKVGFLYAVTQIHAGKGMDLGVIDQPIQREIHTGFPIISGIKGALRHEINFENKEEIFGSEANKDKENSKPGDIVFSEVKILFFPVRSLNKGLVWITCPMVLSRLKTAFKIVGNNDLSKKIEDFLKNINHNEKYTTFEKEEVVSLEEYSIKPKRSDKLIEIVESLKEIVPDDYLSNMLTKNVVVLSEKDFTFFVRNATEILPRVRIDKSTRVVAKGALWYEEYLPQDTVMFFIIKSFTDNSELLNFVSKKIDGNYINIGGKTSVGKGFTYIKLL